MRFSSQTYDWKGRPLVTTNTDGTTKEASYGGCGCAGGAVVTLTDEGTVVDTDPGPGINNVTKKRQQKIYSDVLGRTVKTEVLNWDGAGNFGTGGSVYSTTVNTYNARDQVMSQRQYQGTQASGVYHETSMTYDGYGRPKTKHVPEQQADPNISGSTDHTTWDYNDDGTVQSVTDARGITTAFGYNARRLLTAITYPQNLPVGIPATANVTYVYDAAGNRTTMSDTSGNAVSYVYDSLSRLTSEARQFAGLSGTYTLAYQYTISGQLATVSDQTPGTNTSFSYILDNVGRLSSVTSTGLGATAPLASNAQYRASGALKHRDSGNGTGMNLAYNSRGMVTQYSVSGMAGRAEGSDYQYHPDGRVKFASDHYERSFYSMSAHDKSYEYDYAGRLQRALTGLMANDYLNGTASQFAGSGSYLQRSSYDPWDNLVSREGLYWSETNEIEPQSYQANNRNYSWSYDADGRLISMNEPAFNQLPYIAPIHTYDAAGRHVKNTQTTSQENPNPNQPVLTKVETVDSTYDGDGQQTKRVETRQINSYPPEGEASYYLRSSVLGGQVITNYYANGALKKSFVYAGGALIASSSNGALLWRYNNPVTGDGLETNTQGQVGLTSHLDPEGVEVGATDPADTHGEAPPPQPLPHAGAYAAYLPHSLGGSGNCSVNGAQTGCAFVAGLLAHGLGEECLDDDCGTHQVTIIARNGHGDIIGRSTIDVRDGEPGWNGELDGTYQFYHNNIWGPHDGAEFLYEVSERGDTDYETYYKVGGPLPQSTKWLGVDPAGVRRDLEKMLRKGDCGKFVEDLINRLAEKTKNAFVSDYPLDLFDLMESQGRLVRGGDADKYKVSSTVGGHLVYGNGKKRGDASVYLGSHFNFGIQANSVNAIDAFDTLHELVHHAGLKSYYTDQRVAEVLFKMTGAPGLPDKKDYKDEREFIGANSTYFSKVLAQKCPVLSGNE